MFSISTGGNVYVSGNINADGGAGGLISSASVGGGKGRRGGFGGTIGDAGGGGIGGNISVTSKNGSANINNPLRCGRRRGGGINSAVGGQGGMGTDRAGGRGGRGAWVAVVAAAKVVTFRFFSDQLPVR